MKKILLLCLGAALILTASIGGTLAFSVYSTANSDGTMDIEINQQVRGTDASGARILEPLVWDGTEILESTIYPSYSVAHNVGEALAGGETVVWNEGDEEITGDEVEMTFINDTLLVGAVDNITSVKNNELEKACVRVYIAFEAGIDNLHIHKNETDWTWKRIDGVHIKTATGGWVIDGSFDVYEAVYNGTVGGLLSKDKETTPCLYQVAIDGEKANEAYLTEVGSTYEILVYAQGIQASAMADGATAAEAFEAFDNGAVKDSAYFSNLKWDCE